MHSMGFLISSMLKRTFPFSVLQEPHLVRMVRTFNISYQVLFSILKNNFIQIYLLRFNYLNISNKLSTCCSSRSLVTSA
jgi:hypothetical protein